MEGKRKGTGVSPYKDKDFVEVVEEVERFSWDQLIEDGDENDEGIEN